MWVLVVASIIFGIPLLFKAAGLIGGLVGKAVGTAAAAAANLGETILHKTPNALVILLIGVGGGAIYLWWGQAIWAEGGRVAGRLLTNLSLLEGSGTATVLDTELLGLVSVRHLIACGLGATAAHALRRITEKTIAAANEIKWNV